MSAQKALLPDLQDIVLPDPVSWAPQTVGWWILLGILVLLGAWWARGVLRRRRANLYRKQALARLQEIEDALAIPASRSRALTALPVLVKQTFLACRRRAEVAALSGEPWLRLLDESYGGDGFTRGPGRLLPELAYSAPAATATLRSEDLEALVHLVRQWIRGHRVRV